MQVEEMTLLGPSSVAQIGDYLCEELPETPPPEVDDYVRSRVFNSISSLQMFNSYNSQTVFLFT